MSGARTVASLARLVALRDREVERLRRELADREALREQYRRNLARMAELLADHAASGHAGIGAAHAVLALNGANYRMQLIAMIHAHADDLARHEAGLDAHRAALTAAVLKHRRLAHALAAKRAALAHDAQRKQQKQQDQLAAQAALRRHVTSIPIS
ncbi:hypothetical protein [Burkholderia sp. Ac-20379]|uniref:hypothetical protein n=1 Tax=Burkholderia sp. Ac-20379 TaxID=2703900 RepID=UPI0019803BCA|nr:hypothetical protein [Burkholderia sp. Ac-20379]MBN3728602.1 hypothetical protein [Burkholderia sp. Ac-20379]